MISTHHAVARAFACAALALSACAASAQATVPAADPQAAVPPTRYQNAIGYRIDPAPQARPDQTWVQANAAVAGIDSMSLTMKGMHGAMPQHGHAMPDMPDAPAAAAPAPAAPSAPAGAAAHDHAPAPAHDHAGMHGAMPMPAEHHHAGGR